MAMTKPSAFTFLHANQVDALYTVYTATQIKTFFDSQATELRNYLYSTLTAQIDSDLATKVDLANAVLSGLSVDSITNAYLATDVKVGSLADLDTTVKTSITDSINELVAKIPTKFSQMSGGSEIIADYTTGAKSEIMTFSTEDYDDLGMIDLGTSSSRITIPSGVSLVRFYLKETGAGGGRAGGNVLSVSLLENGSVKQIMVSLFSYPLGIFYTQPIAVTAGKYYQILVDCADFDAAGLYAGTVFGAEVLK